MIVLMIGIIVAVRVGVSGSVRVHMFVLVEDDLQAPSERVGDAATPKDTCRIALRAMAQAALKEAPEEWVTGLTHRQSYKDIFAITVLKTVAVFVVIAVYYLTGIV